MKKYKVRIQEINKSKYLEVVVEAKSQTDAKKIAEAQYSGFKVNSVIEIR